MSQALNAMMRALMIFSTCEADSWSFVWHWCVYTNQKMYTHTILFISSSDFSQLVCFHVKTWAETILFVWGGGTALSEVYMTLLLYAIANWILYLHVKVWLHNAALFLALCKLFLVESIVKPLLKADKYVISRNNGALVSCKTDASSKCV